MLKLQVSSWLLLAIVLLALVVGTPAKLQRRKLTDAELDRIEAQWEEEDEDDIDSPIRRPRDENGKFKKDEAGKYLPPQPQANYQKPEMIFAAVDLEDKKETELLARAWTDKLKSGGIDAKVYVINADRILITCGRGMMEAHQAKDFLLTEELTKHIEIGANKYFKDGKVTDRKGGPPKPAPKLPPGMGMPGMPGMPGMGGGAGGKLSEEDQKSIMAQIKASQAKERAAKEAANDGKDEL